MVMHNNQSYYNSEEHGIEVAKFRNRPVENAASALMLMIRRSICHDGEILWRKQRRPGAQPADLRPAIERGVKYVKEKQLPYLVDVIAEPR